MAEAEKVNEDEEQDDFYTFNIEHMEYLDMNYALVVGWSMRRRSSAHNLTVRPIVAAAMPQELPGKADYCPVRHRDQLPRGRHWQGI
eukprot:13133626-Heterocapsa_arctica.AAC.1